MLLYKLSIIGINYSDVMKIMFNIKVMTIMFSMKVSVGVRGLYRKSCCGARGKIVTPLSVLDSLLYRVGVEV